MTNPVGTHTVANYITCPQRHPLLVIYDPTHNVYGFTCETCGVHSLRGFCLEQETIVEVKVVGKGLPKGFVHPTI